jgi:hypothetical protein
MRTIETTLYQYDELPTEKAKEKAREWYCEWALDYYWWEFIYEDAKTIGLAINTFDCYRHTIEGKLTDTVNDVCSMIIKAHGKSCGTYKLAKSIDRRKSNDQDEIIREFKHALLEEYLVLLNNEADYRTSDAGIEEYIKAKEYEFTVDGERA